MLGKKAQWTKMVIIIIAIFSGLVLLMIIGMWIGTIQVAFHDSLCKFNLFVRHIALGNPITVLGSQLAGTFKLIPPSIPVPCTTNKWTKNESYFISNNTEFSRVLAEEIKRCWDIFGLGAWNSLVFAPSNTFPCFEGTIRFNVTGVFTHINLKDYMSSQEILTIGNVHKSYLQFIPWENIVVLNETNGRVLYFKQTEDGQPEKHYVSVYYVDYFKVGLGFMSLKSSGEIVSTACGTYRASEKATDAIILCIR